MMFVKGLIIVERICEGEEKVMFQCDSYLINTMDVSLTLRDSARRSFQ
jgi:hypothetical protein